MLNRNGALFTIVSYTIFMLSVFRLCVWTSTFLFALYFLFFFFFFLYLYVDSIIYSLNIPYIFVFFLSRIRWLSFGRMPQKSWNIFIRWNVCYALVFIKVGCLFVRFQSVSIYDASLMFGEFHLFLRFVCIQYYRVQRMW